MTTSGVIGSIVAVAGKCPRPKSMDARMMAVHMMVLFLTTSVVLKRVPRSHAMRETKNNRSNSSSTIPPYGATRSAFQKGICSAVATSCGICGIKSRSANAITTATVMPSGMESALMRFRFSLSGVSEVKSVNVGSCILSASRKPKYTVTPRRTAVCITASIPICHSGMGACSMTLCCRAKIYGRARMVLAIPASHRVRNFVFMQVFYHHR